MSDSLPTVALVGAPNSGKTTLYAWLTQSKSKAVNYPGSTTDFAQGFLAPHLGGGLQVLDTPGIYALKPQSPDEEVTLQVLADRKPEAVLVVIDAFQIERHLHSVLTLKTAGFSVGVVLTMGDLVEKGRLPLDLSGLSRDLGVPVLLFDGILARGLPEIGELLRDLVQRPSQPKTIEPLPVHRELSREMALRARGKSVPLDQSRLVSERWDVWFLHPVLGPFLFLLIMSFLFASLYWLAAPFMDAVDGAFVAASEQVSELSQGKLWGDFLANGILASFGAVLVFVPQIFILFFAIGVLESTGYLARAASLIDRPLSAVGLTGRSFVPLLSGFSCAVPAMMAARNISSRRDRWITVFVIPLMTCSARLPVYALFLGFLFADQPLWAGLGLAALYLLAILTGTVAAAILNRLLPQERASFLMMELPNYRLPRFRLILRQSFHRTWSYVTKAGPIIFVIAVLIWAGTTFPRTNEQGEATHIDQSYLGQLGKSIEPVFEPLGVDWRVGVGLISAFAAREVFVATLAVIFNVPETEDEETQTQGLLQNMRSATWSESGRPIFTPATVAGLLVFFVIALQCMSTFAVARQEMGSWKFAVSQLVLLNLLAYVLAVGLVQGLRALGFA